jgi:hypothetical protein
MQSFLILLALWGGSLFNTVPSVERKAGDPQVRMEQLIFQSEDLAGPDPSMWRRTWFTDQPSHLTYERAHGGIGP